MKKLVLATLFVMSVAPVVPFGGLLTPAAAFQSQQIEWKSVLSDALRESRRTGKPVMVAFSADWCPFSRRMDRETYTDSRVVNLSRSFICVKADTESDYGKRLMDLYSVDGTPSVIFLSSSENILKKVTGLQSVENFAAVMQEVNPQITWLSSLDEARRESQRTGKPIMLALGRGSGPYSRRMERETYADSRVINLSRSFICVKVDTESDYGKPLLKKFAVDALPYVIFFSRPNFVVKTVEGFTSAEDFASAMRQALK